jgi:2-methylisocitrate lyase-like PEP mutase family enzyme
MGARPENRMPPIDFRALHAVGELLILPNAWDAASARLIEDAGARAVATTSAGLSWACGWPDGDALPATELIAAVERIQRVLRVPLSVDIERGFGATPEAIADLVAALVDRGVAGINIEDGDGIPDALCAALRAIRARVGAGLYVNVRTDVVLRKLASGEDALAEIIRRGRSYREAGGDGLFVPGLADAARAARIVDALPEMPLNLMWVPSLDPLPALRAAGVRRISTGGALPERALGLVRDLAARAVAGDLDSLRGHAIDYGGMNVLLAERMH